ncbi:MAG: hypothetical protein K2W96_20555, partial [Gemmataceae bacterium]|nr:hypothetical protein [Gemmataceae bacterium]
MRCPASASCTGWTATPKGAAKALADACREAAVLAQSWPGVPHYRRLAAQAMSDHARVLALSGDPLAGKLLNSSVIQMR